MDRAAHFIALTAGDLQLFTHAEIQVGTILTSAGGAVVARGDDDVVLDDDGSVFLAQAGASLGDCLGDIKVIIMLGNALHGELPPENVNLQTDRYYNYNISKTQNQGDLTNFRKQKEEKPIRLFLFLRVTGLSPRFAPCSSRSSLPARRSPP